MWNLFDMRLLSQFHKSFLFVLSLSLALPTHTGLGMSEVSHLCSKFERIDIIFHIMSFRLSSFTCSPSSPHRLLFYVFYSIPQHARRPRLVVHIIYLLHGGHRITH